MLSYRCKPHSLIRPFSYTRSTCTTKHLVRPTAHKRTLWSASDLQTLTSGFFDLATALPYPLSWPPYASTIILTTVISRIVFTLPGSIWAKQRQQRLEEVVLPAVRVFRDEEARRIAMDLQRIPIKEENLPSLRLEFRDKLKHAVRSHRDALMSKYHCSPFLTMFVPAFTQLPLFVFGTMLCSRFATKPTPLEDESFLTLTSLAHPDATGVLPIALGLVTLANVETGHWFLGEEKAARNAKLQKEKEEQREKARATGGKTPSNPNERRILLLPDARSLIQNALRVFSIVRIVIGVMVDGSVLVYWLSSATFGLLQTWSFNWWDARREDRRISLTKEVPNPAPHIQTASTLSRPALRSRARGNR